MSIAEFINSNTPNDLKAVQDAASLYEDAWDLRLEMKRYGNTILHIAFTYYDGLFLDLDDFAEVQPAWFTDPRSRQLWALATELHSEGAPYDVDHLVDNAVLTEHLRINILDMTQPVALPVAIQSLHNVVLLKDTYSYLVEMELKDSDFEQWMAQYVGPDENGVIVLARLPDVEYKPAPEPPKMTTELAEFYRTWAQTPACAELIRNHARNVEAYRTALIKMIDIAAEAGAWTFEAARDWLGEQLGKSGQAAQNNAVKLEKMGLIRYVHGPADDEQTGRPARRVDLTPLLRQASLKLQNPLDDSLATLETRGELDVYRRYVGTGTYGDATMRVNMRTVVEYAKVPVEELLPTLTHSCLVALEYMQTLPAGTLITRRELSVPTGLSPGAAAGAMRRLEELGHITTEWDGPFTPKYYALKKDWQPNLDKQVKRMKSYGARDRLVIKNLSRQLVWLEIQQRSAERDAYMALTEKRRKLQRALAKWKVYAGKRGTYRPFAWQKESREKQKV